MSLLEFKITHADKVSGGVISNESILQSNFNQKKDYEIHAVMKSYEKGLIVLKFEWIDDIDNNGLELIVYRGKVSY